MLLFSPNPEKRVHPTMLPGLCHTVHLVPQAIQLTLQVPDRENCNMAIIVTHPPPPTCTCQPSLVSLQGDTFSPLRAVNLTES